MSVERPVLRSRRPELFLAKHVCLLVRVCLCVRLSDFICVLVSQSLCLYQSLSLCRSLSLSLSPSASLAVCSSVSLSVCLSVSVCLSRSLYMSYYVCLSVCLYVCLSVCLRARVYPRVCRRLGPRACCSGTSFERPGQQQGPRAQPGSQNFPESAWGEAERVDRQESSEGGSRGVRRIGEVHACHGRVLRANGRRGAMQQSGQQALRALPRGGGRQRGAEAEGEAMPLRLARTQPRLKQRGERPAHVQR